MRALVTGADGFVGRHLAAYLARCGDAVTAMVKSHAAGGEPGLVEADVRDGERVADVVRAVGPDRVYHLAAVAIPSDSLVAPVETFEVNALGTLHLLEAVRRHAAGARVLIVASSEVYGRDPVDAPVFDETRPLRPQNPYAASKAAADLLGYQYAAAYGLFVVRARPFNHTGPGQSPRLVWPGFAQQIARAEAGLSEAVVRVGNLDVARDFCDVRDTVRAYHALLETGAPGEAYNVCSGRARLLRELLDVLLRHARRTVRVEVDPARQRADEAPVLAGSADKIRRATGWEARIPIEQTLVELLDWWRESVRQETT